MLEPLSGPNGPHPKEVPDEPVVLLEEEEESKQMDQNNFIYLNPQLYQFLVQGVDIFLGLMFVIATCQVLNLWRNK